MNASFARINEDGLVLAEVVQIFHFDCEVPGVMEELFDWLMTPDGVT